MDEIEDVIRRRAYELWQQAGCPEGRSDEFWRAARAEMAGEGADEAPVGDLGPPIEERPAVAVEHGISVEAQPIHSPSSRTCKPSALWLM